MSSAGAVLRAAGESHAYSIDSSSLEATCSIQETLFAGVLRGFCFFLPALFHYSDYPLERDASAQGAVAGHLYSKAESWQLSSDIGCAFIALDGLAHYYARYPDPELCLLLEEAIQAFLKLDKWGMKIQTHATLTATRGILCFYEATKDPHYFNDVVSLFDFYLAQGMTATYENDNWFNRPSEESWTEPCAVVDSLILSLRLYALKKDERYRILAGGYSLMAFSSVSGTPAGLAPIVAWMRSIPSWGFLIMRPPIAAACAMPKAYGLIGKTKGFLRKKMVRSVAKRGAISSAIIFWSKIRRTLSPKRRITPLMVDRSFSFLH